MWSYETSHWKAGAAVFLLIFERVAPCYWHIINNPMVLVIQAHSLFQCHQSFLTIQIATLIRSCTCLHNLTKMKPSNWLALYTDYNKYFCLSYLCAFHIFQKFNFVWAWSYALAKNNLTQVFNRRIFFVDWTEIEMMILEWNYRFLCIQPIHVKNYLWL